MKIATTLLTALLAVAGHAGAQSTPTGLAPTGTTLPTTSSVTVSWQASPGATFYAVRANDQQGGVPAWSANNCPPNPHYMCIDGHAATSLTFPVTPGHSYEWWVHACNNAGCSAPAFAQFAVASPPPPPAVIVGTLDVANATAVEGWTCVSGDAGISLSVHIYKDGQFLRGFPANLPREQAVANACGGNGYRGFSFTFPDSIKDGLSHLIQAYGVNDATGTSAPLYGSPVSILFPIPVPAGLSPSGTVSGTSVTLSWQGVASAHSYAVRANDDTVPSTRDPRNNCPGNPHFLCVNGLAATSITVPVVPGRSYWWWVHACSATSCGDAAGAAFSVAASTTCIAGGDQNTIMNALSGPGSVANLCPGAVFNLTGTVNFSHDDQEIRTEGYPADNGSKALLRVVTAFPAAINGKSRSRVKLKNIAVDGGRAANGSGYVTEHGALIVIGGNASGQVVDRVRAYEPRNWSILQIIQGDNPYACSGATISNNDFGPAGQPDGTWADGISLGCTNSSVSGNTITDATDGGIVIFGAPGSSVNGNTIIASTRRMLSGIALADYAPFGGDFNGTVVASNVINAAGAQIVVAMPMGPRTWACPNPPAWPDGSARNRGAQVSYNTLYGDKMGYGFVADGVDNWSLVGNVSYARHSGAPMGGCGQVPAAPAAFLRGSDANNSFSALQAQFGAPAYVQSLPYLGPPQ